jgi:Nif-specific regulatory protein
MQIIVHDIANKYVKLTLRAGIATFLGVPPARSASEQPPPSLGERLPAILHLCQRLNAERSLPALLDLLAREATRLLLAERASIFLLDRERMELETRVALGSEPIRFDARQGAAGAAALRGETVNIRDTRSDSRFYSGVDATLGYRTRNLLAVPLSNHEGEIIGAFEVLNRRRGAFGPEDEELLRALSAQAAVAIETAQLVSELQAHRDRLLSENVQLRKEVRGRFSRGSILGTSPRIQRVVQIVERIRDASVDVLITGESGTGKELVARAIHYASPRAAQPFVALNCAALPESLVESELFGIERGVATGVERRSGKFEEASRGTLFLDEIGDLSAAAQAKILRVLQERVVERVGGRRPIAVDVRVVAATNKRLEAEVERGSFRADLFYRLNVVRIETAPLREIRSDIPVLASHFLARSCRELGRPPKTLGPDALRRIEAYPWPGNVRELENEMKRLAVLAPGRVIEEADLSEHVRAGRAGAPPSPQMQVASPSPVAGTLLPAAVEALERRMIEEALSSTAGNQLRAARALGISRQGLIQKLKRYGLYRPVRGARRSAEVS